MPPAPLLRAPPTRANECDTHTQLGARGAGAAGRRRLLGLLGDFGDLEGSLGRGGPVAVHAVVILEAPV